MMSEAEGYVRAEYLRQSANMSKRIKQRSYEMMSIELPSHVLDIGCGSGIDTVAIAEQFGENCRVSGVDIDEDMLQQADALAEEKNLDAHVSHHLADVSELPFETDEFDAVRAEGLFQVLPKFFDPHEIFKEILRVLKPGGKLVLLDTDWASASVDIPNVELERRLMGFFSMYMRPNGLAGRQLYGFFKQHNIQNINIDVIPMFQNDFSKTPYGDGLKKESLKAGFISEEEALFWMQELSMLDKLGEFYSCVNVVMVSGVK
jgi:ubiquinone/menaquinone biosynthesis C-methylase UbiE